MELEKKENRRKIGVIVAEVLMSIATVAIVTILAFVVSGYWISRDSGIERTGILQISSEPTLADVKIDGDAGIFQRTNTSKTLSAGSHTVELTKDGYDSWSKTITISEGLIYRLRYPRLFLKDRETEAIFDLKANQIIENTTEGEQNSENSTADTQISSENSDNSSVLAFSSDPKLSFSPKKDYLLLTDNTIFETLRIDSDNPELKTISVPEDFRQGTIETITWTADESKILINESVDGASKWLLINLNKPSESVNLTDQFGVNISKITMLDDSGNRLLVESDGNLRTLNVSSSQMSRILVENVKSYDVYGDEVAYVYEKKIVAEDENGEKIEKTQPTVAVLDLTSSKSADFLDLDSSAALVTIAKFYDDEEISVLLDHELDVYKLADKSVIFEGEVNLDVATMSAGPDSEFILMQNGSSAAILDMEELALKYWTNDDDDFMTIDENGYLFYSIINGELKIRDFDGQNERSLASNVSREETAISDNHWLYYVCENQLMREKIAD